MRITKISVKGLFGMFDHEIPLNQESRITIVHGPNGVGKTAMLELVHGLFHYEYERIAGIPFEHFRIEFEEGECITLRKLVIEDKGDHHSAISIGFENGRDNYYSSYTPRLGVSAEEIHKHISELRPELNLIHTPFNKQKLYWVSIAESEVAVITLEALLRDYPRLHTEIYGEMPDWLETIFAVASPKLISIGRLKSEYMDTELISAVMYNKNLSERNQYWFPGPDDAVNNIWRIIMQRYEETIDDVMFGIALEAQQALHEEESQEDDSDEDKWKRRSSRLRNMENLIADAEMLLGKTEKVDHELSERENVRTFVLGAALLCDIISKRFLYKTLVLDETDLSQIYMLKLTLPDGCEVAFSALSSGEQHLLILYSKLLFEMERESLVMIDEPELSMHVDWQEVFLKDVQQIVELRNFDILIATHSPTLIDDKWEWMVGLQYPERE